MASSSPRTPVADCFGGAVAVAAASTAATSTAVASASSSPSVMVCRLVLAVCKVAADGTADVMVHFGDPAREVCLVGQGCSNSEASAPELSRRLQHSSPAKNGQDLRDHRRQRLHRRSPYAARRRPRPRLEPLPRNLPPRPPPPPNAPLASAVIKHLVAGGPPVVGAVRDAKVSGENVAALGAKVVEVGSLADAAALQAALEGVASASSSTWRRSTRSTASRRATATRSFRWR